jgi:hypothetical protein
VPKENYTEDEKCALAAVEPWKDAWNTHGEIDRLVDEIYADSCEVFAPFQGAYWVKKGQSKENWKNLEIENEKIWQKRTQTIVNCVVQGNRVAMECELEMQRLDGKVVKGLYAAFLEFNEDGRVTYDHSYIDAPSVKKLVNKPEMDMVPDLKMALQKFLDSQ